MVTRGYVDHADSLGAAARYGQGDVQWLTAGKGIMHSEMFPLLKQDADNPMELFQIWLNLPRADKMVEPHFAMLWGNDVPILRAKDDAGRATEVRVVAGRLGELAPPPPPPSSWASKPEHDVAIWTMRMEPGARWTMPAAEQGTNRTLYFFEGSTLDVGEARVSGHHAIALRPDREVPLEAGEGGAAILLLQGKPIGEPVMQYGPFVMNSKSEIVQAFEDYQRTRFGGWPWPSEDPVHGEDEARFARHADGRTERAPD